MPKFKVGDLVRVERILHQDNGRRYYDRRYFLSRSGVITQIGTCSNGSPNFFVSFQHGDLPIRRSFTTKELEKIEMEPDEFGNYW